ncbi:hypothetical protein BDV35DRAFT_347814 [Aspergillus flavus]|uniref:Uncharacterized protein n=1 Tax=Aspergillus flavus TaxID=5059 RepID=A0A5N6H5F7_ASPFL|nr:hypothetical protein BDV35DRAFT_347814 [Aspergillus flavus]
MKRVGVPAQRVWAIAVIGTTLRFYFYIFLSRFLLCVPVKTPRSILERETQSSFGNQGWCALACMDRSKALSTWNYR